ncbi:hypothetical protein E8E14_006400 [Neopestalotiopsis sp. 37M]|nr:hypothetical protein E8E14_006400 [Neopestalotiopsis sp. 37M]
MASLRGSTTPKLTGGFVGNQDEHGMTASQGIMITSSPTGPQVRNHSKSDIKQLFDNILGSEYISGPSDSESLSSYDASDDGSVELGSHDEIDGTGDKKRRKLGARNVPEFILKKVTQTALKQLQNNDQRSETRSTIEALSLCISVAARQGEHLRYWPEYGNMFRFDYQLSNDTKLVTILSPNVNSRWIAAELSNEDCKATIYDSLISGSVSDKEVRKQVETFCNLNFQFGKKWTIEEGHCAKHANTAASGIYSVVNALHLILKLTPPLEMNVAIWHKMFSALTAHEAMVSKLDQVLLEFVRIPIPEWDVTSMSADGKRLQTLAVQTYTLRAREARRVAEMLSSQLRIPVERWLTELRKEQQENWYEKRILELEKELDEINTAYTVLGNSLSNSRFRQDSNKAILKSLEDGRTKRMKFLEDCRERQVVLKNIQPRVEALNLEGAISMAETASSNYLWEAENLMAKIYFERPME